MTDQELNDDAARAMGWEPSWDGNMWQLPGDGELVISRIAWEPATNIEQAFMVQAKIETLDQRLRFVLAMNQAYRRQSEALTFEWWLANAPARARAEAAVTTLANLTRP